MLEKLNTNMKVLIGISSITILGIFYTILKRYFSPTKARVIEGGNSNNTSQVNNNDNSKDNSKDNIKIISSLKDIIKNNTSNTNKLNNSIKKLTNTIKDFEDRKIHNNHMHRRFLYIYSGNSSYSTSTGELTLNIINLKSDLGFPHIILSIVLSEAHISKSSDKTSKVIMRIIDSKLDKCLGNDDGILQVIPMPYNASGLNNETYNYQNPSVTHITLTPVLEHGLKFTFTNDTGNKHHLSSNYYFKLDLMVTYDTKLLGIDQ